MNIRRSVLSVLILVLIIFSAAVLSGCGKTEDIPDYEIPDTYELNAWTDKIWEGNIVYWEPVAFVTDIDGNMPELKLMYKPDKILEVRISNGFEIAYEGRDFQYDQETGTFSLGNTILLEEGRDYTVSESGKITLNYNRQSLKVTTYDDLHYKYKEGQTHDWLEMPSDHSRYFNLYNELYKSRIYVTYTHSDGWGRSFVPKSEISKLPRTAELLKNKQDINFVIYGDSIATGADGSGPDETVIDVTTCLEITYKGNSAPYTPSWAEMVTQKLRQVYGYEGINKINRAAGASGSGWGSSNAEYLVCTKDPDVLVIAFGMNDGCAAEIHKQNILGIIRSVHEFNPDCEFILMSSMEPTPELGNTNLSAYEKAYYEIQKENKDLHIAVCPVNSVFWAVMQRGKLFTDVSSSNFNHPNDFLIRIYAQTLLATLGV